MACRRTMMCVNDLRHRFGGDMSSSDLKEGSYHCAHHVTQKPVSGDDEGILRLRLLYPFRFAHIADGGLYVRVDAAERSKILFAEQQCCGFVHRLEIQPRSHARVVNMEERVFAGGNAIAVCACRSVESRMSIVAHEAKIADGDGRRQKIIEPCAKIGRHCALDIKMRYHLLGMNPCVRASGESQRHRAPQDGSKRCLHLGLHRVAVGLALRAVEICAVI